MVILTVVIGIFIYHELWFLEYYHLPPVSFVKIESDRTKLINGIKSYQSIDELKSLFGPSSFQWDVGKESRPSLNGRPPFNMHTITVKNYSHLGVTGELNISFFNNRLITTMFYPSEVEKYIETLCKVERIKFDNNREITMSPYTRVRYGSDYKNRKYIEWSDIRLDKEVELWIKRYS